ncbi:hypothetical protein [Sphingomonas sediminicola]|uniref:hypothetical protein n=1 Tax=Sphingomonas sediminicola TaxID=386874 RepID=UPI001FE46909|nr:hypothetical protein [Sphingomonas sediminicola]
MAVGYFYQHMPKDFWPVNNMGDAAILYCFIFLYFVFRGRERSASTATPAPLWPVPTSF